MTPSFAVVGHPNKGKSSIVSTLAEDERVEVSERAGTTTRAHRYPMQVDGRVLYELIDTPGFQRPRRVLAWLQDNVRDTHERPDAVARFVASHQGQPRFHDECELLRPLVEGAGILYVVDGAKPYGPEYEAEMEILRWTGQPGMALINRIGDADHADEWRRALDQYFKVVRDFDAHSASYEERVRLLRTFRELRDDWIEPLDRAIRALEAEQHRRAAEATDLVTDLVLDELTFTIEARLEDGAAGRAERERLEAAFHDWLRDREHKARAQIEALYRHGGEFAVADDLSRPVFDQDLFAEKTWDLFGLKPKQVLALYSLSGLVAGGAIDASVGGASMLTGAAFGALLGAGAGFYHLKQRFARAASVDSALRQLRRAFSSGTAYRVGPHAHPNFPFVLIDRALAHLRSVRSRAHARQDDRRVEAVA
ncbi:MAG: DUF3482 domain-containing protein, partial [Gammaproteobacteria bacterium]|nr:DUF3482 domain-containing protein [Gammaproteobacteria bacterium]